MRKVFGIGLKLLGIIFLLLVLLVARTLIVGGVFTKLDEKLTAECERIPVKPGAEDITLDREHGFGFVSAEERRSKYEGKTPERGGLFVFDLENPAGTMRETALDAPADLQPHGIGLYKGHDGDRLFVVSHPVTGGHTVEIFDIAVNGDLVHAETVSDPLMHSPNDVVPVGPRQFYVTNDSPPYEGLKAELEKNLLVPNTDALYFDGGKMVRVVDNLNSANGINISADGAAVYISEVVGKRISVFDRNRDTGELTLSKQLKVNTLPDNIELGPNGMLYTGGHTKIFDYLAHAKDPDKIAVSHVVRIDPKTGQTEDILINLDGTFNAATVGAVTEDRLFVGSVFETDILSCPLP